MGRFLGQVETDFRRDTCADGVIGIGRFQFDAEGAGAGSARRSTKRIVPSTSVTA